MYYHKHKMKYSALSWFAFGMLHKICVRSTFRLEDKDSMKTFTGRSLNKLLWTYELQNRCNMCTQ